MHARPRWFAIALGPALAAAMSCDRGGAYGQAASQRPAAGGDFDGGGPLDAGLGDAATFDGGPDRSAFGASAERGPPLAGAAFGTEPTR